MSEQRDADILKIRLKRLESPKAFSTAYVKLGRMHQWVISWVRSVMKNLTGWLALLMVKVASTFIVTSKSGGLGISHGSL